MYPTLFKIGDIAVSSFSVMVLIAFLVGYKLFESELDRKGKNGNFADLVLVAAVIGGLGGAKLLFLYQRATVQAVIEEPLRYLSSGFTFFGGLLVAIFLFWIVTRIKNVSFWEAGDAAAPGLVLAYAVGRIGCFLVGDDYGIPTDLPWGISFPEGSPPTYEEVHPTQLYDTLTMTLAFAFLWRMRKKDVPVGWISGVTLVILGAQRFLIELLRTTTPSFVPGLSQAQLISLGLLVWGIAKLIQINMTESNPVVT